MVGKAPGQRPDRFLRRLRRLRVTVGAAARGSIGSSSAFEVVLVDVVGLPRLLELVGFLAFHVVDVVEGFDVVAVVEALPVVVGVDDFHVVVVEEGLPVVGVVDDRCVVEVVDDEEELVVDELDDDVGDPTDDGPVVVEDDDAAVAWACVTWMLRWPSLESELPSLATKLKVSTSTPAGAW